MEEDRRLESNDFFLFSPNNRSKIRRMLFDNENGSLVNKLRYL